MPILYRDGGACYFSNTSDARDALRTGWSEDPAGYVLPVLTAPEQQQAADLSEQWRLGVNLSGSERTLVANWMLTQADPNENWRSMPSSPINRWY